MSQYIEDSVENRTVVAVDPTDVVRWVKNLPGQPSSLVTESGTYGMMDDYRGIVGPREVGKTKLKGPGLVAYQRLVERLQGMGIDPDEIDETHLKGASLTLAGYYGEEVSLVGLDPRLNDVLQDILETDTDYEHLRDTVRPQPNDIEHPFTFMVRDGALEVGAIEDGGDRVSPPKVAPEELDTAEKTLRKRWDGSHPKRTYGYPYDSGEYRAAKAGAQQMDQQRENAAIRFFKALGKGISRGWKTFTKGISRMFGNRNDMDM